MLHGQCQGHPLQQLERQRQDRHRRESRLQQLLQPQQPLQEAQRGKDSLWPAGPLPPPRLVLLRLVQLQEPDLAERQHRLLPPQVAGAQQASAPVDNPTSSL